MYTFKEIAKELKITETQAKSKLKKAGYGINDKLDETQFKLLKAQSNPKALEAKAETETVVETVKTESKTPTTPITLQSLATEEIPLENLLEIAEMLQLDVNAIPPDDANILLELVGNSIQLNKIEEQAEETKKQREAIKNNAFQLELESAHLNAEMNALLIHKVSEMAHERKLLELEKTSFKQLESASNDFQSRLLQIMPKDDVIDVEVNETQSPFLKLERARMKLLKGI